MDQTNSSEIEILKKNQLILKYPFDVLKFIQNLEIQTSLDSSFYIQHTIKKRNGSVRILNEPKQNLKLVQKKLLDLIDFFIEKRKASFPIENKLIDGVIAYRKNKSVVQNANFHIGQEFVLKLDIKDFFNEIDTRQLHFFWVRLLKEISQKIMIDYVFAITNSPKELDSFIQLLATKLIYITSIDFHLPQGSSTSGVLANYYLANFDNRLLNYCINRGLNYSRYSDDITISGKLENLKTGSILGAVQYLLKENKLSLNKKKTKVLRSNRRQLVTGIVVNVKKTAGREYKRTIRQEIYYLKKFREDHILKKEKNTIKYLEKLLGKISWVCNIEKNDKYFIRYKGEVMLILRFLHQGKTLKDAFDYIAELDAIYFHLNSEENKIEIEGVEWKTKDEKFEYYSTNLSLLFRFNKAGKTKDDAEKYITEFNKIIGDSDSGNGIVVIEGLEECGNSIEKVEAYKQIFKGIHVTRKNTFFNEHGLKNYLKIIKDGWRLPSIDDYKSYLDKTHFEDRLLLGLKASSDPMLNGLYQNELTYAQRKIGVYWTSDMNYISNLSPEYSIGRNVFVSLSKNWKNLKKINVNLNKISKSTRFTTINFNKNLLNNDSNSIIVNSDYIEDKTSLLQFLSLRLVRDTTPISDYQLNTKISIVNWNKVSSSKKSTDLSNLNIESIPDESLNNWKSSYLLLSKNKLSKGLVNYPPVLKIDLSYNEIQEFNFDKIPKTVKHLLLDGNSALKTEGIPIERFTKHLHELIIPEKKHEGISINSNKIYQNVINSNQWFEIDSNDTFLNLSKESINVKHLKIIIKAGSNQLETLTLFKKLQIFENLISLQIVIEPINEDLLGFLNQLKSKGIFTKEDLDYIENLKKQNPIKSDCLQDSIQFWLYGKLEFIPSDLVNPKLINLFLDFNWFQGCVFHDDFNIKLERYHILNPGTLPCNLPATSTILHDVNILVKGLGHKFIYEWDSLIYDEKQKTPKLVFILPFDSITIYHVFNDLFSIYPNNQRHVENLVLVLSSWETKKLTRGKVETFFTKSSKYSSMSISNIKKLKPSDPTFNFPLLSYSWEFDVYKLNNPIKSILFKGETKDNHFVLKQMNHPLFDNLTSICYFNNTYVNLYDEKFLSDNSTSLSVSNFLIVQNIFPNLETEEGLIDIYEFQDVKSVSKPIQFKITTKNSKYFFSQALITKNKDKQEIISLINNSKINPLHLPNKYFKDKEVMLAAIEFNPFSIVYAHKSLLIDEEFILSALKISLRTIIFIDAKFLKSKNGSKIIHSIYDFISSIFKPHEFNYIVNQLNKKVNVSKEENVIRFGFDVNTSSEINEIYNSFVSEMIYWKCEFWYSMNTILRDKLIELALNSNYFNVDGYYTNLDLAKENSCTFLDLSYQDLSNLDDKLLNDFNSLNKSKIKTLNLSFTNLTELYSLPQFEACEVLYLDGLIQNYISASNINLKFPKLKKLYIRCFKSFFTHDPENFIDTCVNIELIDFRTECYENTGVVLKAQNGRSVMLVGDY
jgi:RNA-directed DNA polymerase